MAQPGAYDRLSPFEWLLDFIDAGGTLDARGPASEWRKRPVLDLFSALDSLFDPCEVSESVVAALAPRTVDIPEAAEILGCSLSEITSLVERHALGGVKINGLWRLSRMHVSNVKWFRDHGYNAP
jgi:hypothetical protein